MEKCAILIGINDTPNLPYLASPCTYARKMDNWAKSQDFETKLFVDLDEDGQKIPVKVEDIMEAVEQLLKGNPAQLLIYFSGHGFEVNPGNEVWLLPDYERWSHQAIDMAKNNFLAIETGADHIIFISDACRSIKKDDLSRHVVGSAIIPSLHKKNYDVIIDTLYSTWPGQPSIEYKDETGQYRSIYSECLLECLQGQVSEVIREIKYPSDTSSFPAVICYDLGQYLKKTVPIITAEKTSESQHPNNRVTSTEPIYISRFNAHSAKSAVGPDPYILFEESDFNDYTSPPKSKPIREKLRKVQGWKKEESDTDRIQDSIDLIDSINQSLVNDALPYDKTGLIIHGNEKPDIFAFRERPISWKEDGPVFNGVRFVNFDRTHSDSPLILISNPSRTGFYPVTLLPEFITSVIFKEEELINIDYLPTKGYRRKEAIDQRKKVAKRKAEIVTAAKNGIFQGTEELGSYIRKYKSLDPTLGLFAAYAYFQSGKFTDVADVYRYMEGEYEPVLPEVSLLTYLSDRQARDNFPSLGMIFPMLTQGWSYLSLIDHVLTGTLQTYLRPGLWTSFNRSGLERLYPLFKYIT